MSGLFLLVLLAAFPPLGDEAAAASIREIQARPEIYAGKRVRLHGQVDACYFAGCHLCPEDARAADLDARCLALEFDPLRGSSGDWGADLQPAFRYADVVLTATFDPSCLRNACTDNATVLRDGRVERVTKRRHSSDGINPGREPLLPAGGSAAEAVAAAAKQGSGADHPIAIFATSSDPDLKERAVVCRSLLPPAEGIRWPRTWEAALLARGTEDLYRCWTARKQHGEWIITLE